MVSVTVCFFSGIVRYCQELSSTVWYCQKLSGTVWYYQELSGTVRNSQELPGTVWYCQVLPDTVRCGQVFSGTVRNCQVLSLRLMAMPPCPCKSCFFVPASHALLFRYIPLRRPSCILQWFRLPASTTLRSWQMGPRLASVLCPVLCFVLCSVLCYLTDPV